MADNVDFQTAALATPANATKVATDQLVGGEHVQYFKLMDGTPDGTTKAIVDANGLLTNVGDRPARQLGIVASIAAAVALAAGSALIGSVKLSDGVDTALISAAGELSTDVSDRAGRALGIVASITAPVDVSDRAGRALGVIASITNPVAVTGTFWQATQPVSLAAAVDVSDRVGRALGVVASITAAVDVSDRAARLLGHVILDAGTAQIGLVKVSDGTNTAIVKAGSASAVAGDAALVVALSPNNALPEMRAATLVQSTTAAVNTALTSTLPAAGAGLFHYITSIRVEKLYSVIGVAAGAGVIITTTNLNGLAFTTEQLASAAGTVARVVDTAFATPLKSAVANTATTIVAPQQLQTIWRITVTYFTAP